MIRLRSILLTACLAGTVLQPTHAFAISWPTFSMDTVKKLFSDPRTYLELAAIGTTVLLVTYYYSNKNSQPTKQPINQGIKEALTQSKQLADAARDEVNRKRGSQKITKQE